MRTLGIWRYHMASSRRSLALLGGVVLAASIALLMFMMPYMADTMVQVVPFGGADVVVTRTEANKPSLNEPFGTSGAIYAIYMAVFACTLMTSDRRYMLSNNVSRYELMLASFLSTCSMAIILTALQYVLDLLCRLATYLLGFQIYGMVWSPQLILASTADYLPALMAQVGNMIAAGSAIALVLLLFARWKKLCVALCVCAVLLPVMLANFLPANWLDWVIENASYVIERLYEFFRAHKDIFLVGVPAWRVLLQQTLTGAVLYAAAYLVIRRLPVRIK